MPEQKFEVLLTGAILPGFERDQVIAALAKLFNQPADKVGQLLLGKPRRIKAGIDQVTAEKYLQQLRAVGADCRHRPIANAGSAGAGTASPAPANAPASAPRVAASVRAGDAVRLTQDSLRAAFNGDIDTGAADKRYSLAIFGVALFVLLMPLVYLLLTAGVAVGTWWFAVSGFDWVSESPRLGRLLAWGCPVFAGVVLVFFMVKPVLHSIHPYNKGIAVNLDRHPLLATFIREIVHKTGAPMPQEVRLDMDVNAYAAPLKGFSSLSRKQLVLGIGLPLIAGCSTRQLAGIIAHELGHFAQQNGMQASYVIGSINSWFSRCVYMRDSWDERLDDWYERFDDQRGLFIMTARAGVWVGRRILSLFLILSAIVSRNLSRQMEFDADRYECIIAGSETFASSARRLQELGIGQQLAIEDLNHAWQDGRLSDDMIPAIVTHADNLSADYQDYIRHALSERSTGMYDTHPSDGERIEAATQLAKPGIFTLELPASVLIRDFPAVCKHLTRDMYEKEWQLQFSDNQLVAAEGVAQQTRERNENDACLASYLGALFHPSRIVVPMQVAPRDVADRDRLAATLQEIVLALRDRIPVYEQLLNRLQMIDTRMADVYKGRMLLQNGIPIAAAEFHLPEATAEAADAAWARVRSEYSEVLKLLRPIEQLIGKRIGLEFALIIGNGDKTLVAEYQSLVATLSGLARIEQAMDDFYIHAATLDQLVHAMSEGRDVADAVLDQDIRQCVEDYTRILQLLGNTPYPFERGDAIHTLREHLLDCAGSPDLVRVQFARVWASYCCVREVRDYLNRRIMSRLARMAQALEDDLHVPHLKVADKPKQATA